MIRRRLPRAPPKLEGVARGHRGAGVIASPGRTGCMSRRPAPPNSMISLGSPGRRERLPVPLPLPQEDVEVDGAALTPCQVGGVEGDPEERGRPPPGTDALSSRCRPRQGDQFPLFGSCVTDPAVGIRPRPARGRRRCMRPVYPKATGMLAVPSAPEPLTDVGELDGGGLGRRSGSSPGCGRPPRRASQIATRRSGRPHSTKATSKVADSPGCQGHAGPGVTVTS